jgi:hypothetical protein
MKPALLLAILLAAACGSSGSDDFRVDPYSLDPLVDRLFGPSTGFRVRCAAPRYELTFRVIATDAAGEEVERRWLGSSQREGGLDAIGVVQLEEITNGDVTWHRFVARLADRVGGSSFRTSATVGDLLPEEAGVIFTQSSISSTRVPLGEGVALSDTTWSAGPDSRTLRIELVIEPVD